MGRTRPTGRTRCGCRGGRRPCAEHKTKALRLQNAFERAEREAVTLEEKPKPMVDDSRPLEEPEVVYAGTPPKLGGVDNQYVYGAGRYHR